MRLIRATGAGVGTGWRCLIALRLIRSQKCALVMGGLPLGHHPGGLSRTARQQLARINAELIANQLEAKLFALSHANLEHGAHLVRVGIGEAFLALFPR